MEKKAQERKAARPCPACHGAGQTSFFKGESRFLLSEEECPLCCGLGVVFDDHDDNPEEPGSTRRQTAS